MPGSKVGARRLLKIVANIIDTTGSTGATITYNLDNNLELPAGNFPSFADPTTQAKTGADGTPNAWQGPFPDTASPNFFPPVIPGPFPKAADGGDGYAGGRGGTGAQGMDGPTLEIWTTNVIGGVTIDLRGQQGGNGGKGGNGQFGGPRSGGVTRPSPGLTPLGRACPTSSASSSPECPATEDGEEMRVAAATAATEETGGSSRYSTPAE